MSVVFVDTGQAGNQVGYAVLDSLYQHLRCGPDEQLEAFFRISYDKTRTKRKVYARAVCVDTEPKVINECIERTRSERRGWLYDPKHVIYRHGGAGNNWAMGYDMCQGEFLDGSLDCIRREIEHSDKTPCLCVVHSIAGGTGSGCGTRITEAISDEFTSSTRINIAVAPFHFGEVVVQHYNAILSLSKVSNSSHGVFTFENEVYHQMCRDIRNIERPTLYNVNELIASSIVPALLHKYPAHIVSSQLEAGTDADNRFLSNTVRSPFLPKRQQQGGVGVLSNREIVDIEQNICHMQSSTIIDDIKRLCADPGYRFLDINPRVHQISW